MKILVSLLSEFSNGDLTLTHINETTQVAGFNVSTSLCTDSLATNSYLGEMLLSTPLKQKSNEYI
jgi:hypothetical protein